MKSICIPVLLVLLSLQGCISANYRLVPDKTAKEIFSRTELNGIMKMTAFVDSVVVNATSKTDINEAYHSYFQNLATIVASENIFPAFVKDSAKFLFLESLDKESVEAIWRIDDSKRMVRLGGTTYTDVQITSLNLNLLGSYQAYLEQIGKSDSIFHILHNNIQISGDISPSSFGWFLNAHQEFDFKIFKNRLWATVFLLRMCDPIEEQLDRYQRNRNT